MVCLWFVDTSEQSPSTGCRDWPFAIVFLLNVAAIIVLMVRTCIATYWE